jgi:hypothetical protein
MTGICAFQPAGVDVNLPLQIGPLDASFGRMNFKGRLGKAR